MKVIFNNLAVPMQFNVKQSDTKHKSMLNFKAVNIKNKNPYINAKVREFAVWFDEFLSNYMEQHPRHGFFSYITSDGKKEIVLHKNPSFEDEIKPKDLDLTSILFEEKKPKGRIEFIKYLPCNKDELIYSGERFFKDHGDVWENTEDSIKKTSEKFIEYAQIFQKLLAPLKENPIKELHNDSFDSVSYIN